MAEYKQSSHSLRKAIKQAKRQYRDKVESQFNGSDTRRMWQGQQTIMDNKRKTSHVADSDVCFTERLLPIYRDLKSLATLINVTRVTLIMLLQ